MLHLDHLEQQDKHVLQEVLDLLVHQEVLALLVLQEVLEAQEVLDRLDKMAVLIFMYRVQYHSFG